MAHACRVIGKVGRGKDVGGLLRYLFGPGRCNEHSDPHVVARWDDSTGLFPLQADAGAAPRRRLASLLEQPLAVLTRKPKQPVWHCSLRTAPGDRRLSDAEWTEAAVEVLHRTGLAPREDDAGCRWVAVRHADDHVHLVVTLARQDGRPARASNDYFRVGEACRWAESRYELTSTPVTDRTARRQSSRAEAEKASRSGRAETPRDTLRRRVRRAAAASSSPDEFMAQLASVGLLVRQRLSNLDATQVTGYAVALPGDRNATSEPIWFGGGKLAADLSLPKLLVRWGLATMSSGQGQRLTGAAREAAWARATRTAAQGTAEIRRLALTDPGAATDTAHATSDALSVVAYVVEGRAGGPLTDACEAYDRAARELWGRPPVPTRTGEQLRRAARTLHLAGGTSRDETAQAMALVAQLTALVEEVARLRDVQHRAAQAAAARAAAERLRRVAPTPAQRPAHARTRRHTTVPRLEGAAR